MLSPLNMLMLLFFFFFFFFNDTATTEIYTLSLHDALPISSAPGRSRSPGWHGRSGLRSTRSEEHTSELQSLRHLVCRLLLEKKKTNIKTIFKKKQQKNKIPTHTNPIQT